MNEHDARKHHEQVAYQQQALDALRSGMPLAEYQWKRVHPTSRLPPVVDKLRNAHGFTIDGDGSADTPYTMSDCNQMPQRLAVTDPMKAAYYQTQHWHDMRRARKEFDSRRCVICSSTVELVVHHIRYQLFAEDMQDLMTVCGKHHDMIHDNSRIKFPSGMSLDEVRQLGIEWEFPEWLLPPIETTFTLER